MKRYPLNDPETLRIIARGPAWREHPDYYAEEPPEDDIPWFGEEHVELAMARMRNLLAREAEPDNAGCITSYEHRCRNLRDELLRTAGQDVLADLARVALGMKPERR